MLTLLAAAFAADLPDIDAPLRTGQKSTADAAVVIGVEDYAFLPDVPFARRDAESVYNLMVYTRGIPTDRVSLLTDGASRERILAEVKAKAAQVGPGGTLRVYFAGHGAASPTTSERLLLGLDTLSDTLSVDARGLPLSQVQAAAHGTSVVLWTDACFTGKGRDGGYLLADKRSFVPSNANAGANVVQWDASTAGQASGPLPGASHGAFTYFSVGALRGWADGELDGKRDGTVTGEEASAYVSRAMRSSGMRDQQPVMVGDGAATKVLMVGGKEGAPEVAAVEHHDEQQPSDYAAKLAALKQAQADADAASAAHESRVAQAVAKKQAEAKSAWADTNGIVAAGGSAGKAAAELYVTSFGAASVVVDGERRSVVIPEVEEAKAALTKTTGPGPLVDTGATGFGDEGVELPGGSFLMGSPTSEAGRRDDEVQHPVTVSGFVMARTEVSQALWTAVMDKDPPLVGVRGGGESLPVELVFWCDAAEFANRLSAKQGLVAVYGGVVECMSTKGASVTMNPSATGWRLPTEAEWEYAARAGATDAWGSVTASKDVCQIGNVNDRTADYFGLKLAGTFPCTDGQSGPAPVGSYRANAWGLYDMTGNLAELVWDRYADYRAVSAQSPTGYASGSARVARGGSFLGGPVVTRVAARDWVAPDDGNPGYGIRLAKSRP